MSRCPSTVVELHRDRSIVHEEERDLSMSSAYERVVRGKLNLKGGQTLSKSDSSGIIKKKKKKKTKIPSEPATEGAEAEAPTGLCLHSLMYVIGCHGCLPCLIMRMNNARDVCIGIFPCSKCRTATARNICTFL